MIVTEAAKLLGISVRSTEQQIKKAHRRMARRWHPDLHRKPEAHGRMVAVNEAYTLLLAFASIQPSRPQPCRPTPTPQPTPKTSPRRAAAAPTEPVVRHRVVWSGPPVVNSKFFETRGYTVRPTDGRVAFRLMKGGEQPYTLEHHPDDPELLICRNARGDFVTIDGVRFWLDDGTSIIPYIEGSI